MTGFHHACIKGHANVVKIFMENAAALKIDLNAIDNSGLTGFHHACEDFHEECIHFGH